MNDPLDSTCPPDAAQSAPPGVVNISQRQAEVLQYEHRQFAGLAGIPKNAAYAA
jgi:hypothetical protein